LLLSLAAIVCICLAAWFFFRDSSPFSRPQNRDVHQLASERDWGGLLKYAAAETDRESENALMWYYRGYALYNLDRYPEAQRAYEKAVQVNPEFVDALLSLGVIDASHRNYKGAIDRYLAALKYRPGYPIAQQNLAIAYYFDGQHDRAWDTWRELEKTDPARAEEIQRRFFFADARPARQLRDGTGVSASASTPASRRPPPCPECIDRRQ
jgi:tetratricopeptide (TPR) repeat protein